MKRTIVGRNFAKGERVEKIGVKIQVSHNAKHTLQIQPPKRPVIKEFKFCLPLKLLISRPLLLRTAEALPSNCWNKKKIIY